MSCDLDSQSNSSELEIDYKVWSLRRRISCNGYTKTMPPMQAWQTPPGALTFGPRWEAKIAAAARRLARCGGASPKSYWLPATAQPTSLLQRFALRVFQFHSKRLGFTTKTVKRLAGCAGAEFWVQRRGAEVKQARRGMNWHFDKDEDLLDDVGLCVHPLVATATYLTDQGAPLVILSAPTLRRQEDGAPDADAPPPSPGSDAAAFVAFPARGLHVAFGGDLLHGVPAELECRPGERLALLVNVWLHHRPSGLQTCGKSSGTTRGSTKPGSALRVRHRRCPKGGLAISPGLAQWHVDGLRIPRDLHEGVWRIQQKQLRVVTCKRKSS